MDMSDGSGESYSGSGAGEVCEEDEETPGTTGTPATFFPTVPNPTDDSNHTAPTDPDTTSPVVIIEQTGSTDTELPSDFIADRTASAYIVLPHWTVAMAILTAVLSLLL